MKKLLIVMDPHDRHQHALGRGIELARATGASLEIVAFVHEFLEALPDKTEVRERARDSLLKMRQTWLERMLAMANCKDLKTSTLTVWEKHIHQWLIARCSEQQVDAVLKTGNRSETFLYTPTDWHLIRECPAAVMLVAAAKWHQARPILVAVDLNSTNPVKQALNHRLIERGYHLAKALGAELHLVHALHTPTLLAELDMIHPARLHQEQYKALLPKVEHLCNTWHLKPEQVHLVAGLAQEVIPRVASEIKADMVVIGTTGKTGLRARVIGNTAEKVLTALKTDLLALKPVEAKS
ncbi:universal stress protein E [Marinobacter sp. LV10R520-4]|uniref:universal stress protein n=1 Tax=Marinobacter sp. LV10R520-4 TaxID=1761796 RepID=UPI000BF5292C|nr:universal stress protein [Marinobacter sp. LV10R520-4]PFG51953.1 universal stress protein E [Marinobacter sp. LV10R520-4]